MHGQARGAVNDAGSSVSRCWWAGDDPLYVAYHDREWGLPVADDRRLFEKLCLEGFQSGLSWLTILRKRESFREAFAGFDFARVARFTGRDVERLLTNAAIVRHRGKIESTRNNAQRALALADEFGQQLNLVPPSNRPAMEPIPVPATIAFSRALDFEDRGEVDRAIQEYERTLELHPSHRDAQLALQRLRGTQ